jgi:hypothetical protein
MMLLFDRVAVAEVGDDLVFGLQQGVRARLQDACGLLNGGDTESGRCDRFAAILCRVLAPWLCGCWDRRFLPRISSGLEISSGSEKLSGLLWSSRRDLSAVGLDRE